MRFRRSTLALLPAAVAIAASLSACDKFFPPLEEHYRGIDVYADRYEYRYMKHSSARSLSIAIEASPEPIEVLNLRECVSSQRLTEVLNVLRERNELNFRVEQPPVACAGSL